MQRGVEGRGLLPDIHIGLLKYVLGAVAALDNQYGGLEQRRTCQAIEFRESGLIPVRDAAKKACEMDGGDGGSGFVNLNNDFWSTSGKRPAKRFEPSKHSCSVSDRAS